MKAPLWQWIAAGIALLIAIGSFNTESGQSVGCGAERATTRITWDSDASFAEKMDQVTNARYGRREQVPCGQDSGGDGG